MKIRGKAFFTALMKDETEKVYQRIFRMSMKMKLKQIKIWNNIERLSPDPIGCNYLILSNKADSRAD